MRTALVFVILAIYGSWTPLCRCEDYEDLSGLDLLLPYKTHHGPKYRTHREVRECQHVRYGNLTHSKHKAFQNFTLPLVKSQYKLTEVGEYYYEKRTVTVLLQTVNNPAKTFSILEPNTTGTCQNGSALRATVSDSAKQKNCILATNAGFFDTKSGECHGNIFSDGRLVQDSGGVQNVHFGVTEDGYIFVGYLSELDLVTQKFTQLVGGVLWIIREGELYLDESIKIECSETEETGTLERFATVNSARIAVGHDKDGRILIAEIDGKTGSQGVSLYQMADILLDLGFVNAINLDGGGSATVIINNTLANHPSDQCRDKKFNCERAVSTILCVHEPECEPRDCSGHGDCHLGSCDCWGQWAGSACDRLECLGNCSGHGVCSQDGCLCDSGWHGNNCSDECPEGSYGHNCSMSCCCENNALCHPVTGQCRCQPGFSGTFCQSVCAYGFYGAECGSVCNCDNSCFCHPVTGSCNTTHLHDSLLNDYQQAGSCIANEMIKSQDLVHDQSEQYRLCVSSSIVLGILAAISIITNIILISLYLKTRRRNHGNHNEDLKRTIRKFVFRGPEDETETNSDESMETTTLFQLPHQRGKS